MKRNIIMALLSLFIIIFELVNGTSITSLLGWLVVLIYEIDDIITEWNEED